MALYRERFDGGTSSSKLNEESGIEEESKIEQASDDSDDDEEILRRRRRNRRLGDSEYREAGGDEDSDEAPLDDLEPDNIDDHFEEHKDKKKPKPAEKATTRRHRTEVEEANLMGDEQEETVFIDNLPNDE
mmetsp:Transcript_4252/g.5670  ORF Transcript_4252/g.5670 Transcript_4252/m.5670 type:complete len:131 (-) Transcript_4252:917-1309(-)|eukprot:CAMPEP_0185578794 /NCGR_PEP_ID=MMETSP0434-20130131/13146_1 /TAXON_ID=626734 ORGANISM="Favella taraikaensis, Strain Fe Narragansett Bay" /NCGR_SAMPLE_ID=MMETSP0434 /ASSEMBLY_ACC=CAM_ASM_000379 /LENGTH=130 /DNA_ID=CAMNT_0028196671 /DNA_START=703 /DNA_END=1095 /DNA_ORIENTATION=-